MGGCCMKVTLHEIEYDREYPSRWPTIPSPPNPRQVWPRFPTVVTTMILSYLNYDQRYANFVQHSAMLIWYHATKFEIKSSDESNRYTESIYVNGELHNPIGPAMVSRLIGIPGVPHTDVSWYLDGVRHRHGNLPAVIKIHNSRHTLEYWVNGQLSRTDGPAIDNGSAYEYTARYYLDGKPKSEPCCTSIHYRYLYI